MTHEPLDLTPEPASRLESWRAAIARLLGRTNARHERQAAAAEANRPHREREAATRAAMTGEQIAKAGAKALGRVGGGAL